VVVSQRWHHGCEGLRESLGRATACCSRPVSALSLISERLSAVACDQHGSAYPYGQRAYQGGQKCTQTDVMAVRLWFDQRIPLANASNTASGFDADTVFTFYDLNALQDEYRHEKGSVIEVLAHHPQPHCSSSTPDPVGLVASLDSSAVTERCPCLG
jgi:hypothetical protein